MKKTLKQWFLAECDDNIINVPVEDDRFGYSGDYELFIDDVEKYFNEELISEDEFWGKLLHIAFEKLEQERQDYFDFMD